MGMTLSEISREIGVSTATISRVINNEDSVTPETKAIVLEALEKFDYHYRNRRKSSSSKNADTVLVISGSVTNPVNIHYIDGIRNTLEKSGKTTLITISDYEEKKELTYLQYAKEAGISGVFMLNIKESNSTVSMIKSMSVPIILVNRYLKCMDTDLVTIDNYRCGFMSTKYLIDRGHTNIANITGPVEESVTCSNRTEGYMAAMRSSGLKVGSKNIFHGDRTYKSGYQIGLKIAQMPKHERFTGVYCITGIMADGFVDAIKLQGLEVPRDISLICNDSSNREKVTHNSITCIEADYYSIGVAAAELYLDRCHQKSKDYSPKRIVYPPVITEHDSVKTID